MKNLYCLSLLSLLLVRSVISQDYPVSSNYWPITDATAKWFYANETYSCEIYNSGSGGSERLYLFIKGTWGDSACCNPFHINFPGPPPLEHYTLLEFYGYNIYAVYLGNHSRKIAGFSTQVGDSFYTNDSYTSYIKCLSRDSTVTVPAGTFEHCSVYNNGAIWAPGIGLVNELVAYRLNNVWYGQVHVEKDEMKSIPSNMVLFQNYPNPFNMSTEIEFTLPYSEATELYVNDLAGRRVRNILSVILPPGYQQIIWDGQDNAGKNVPTGIYFIHLKAGSQHKTIKALVTR